MENVIDCEVLVVVGVDIEFLKEIYNIVKLCEKEFWINYCIWKSFV